jgi:hypothetical protein
MEQSADEYVAFVAEQIALAKETCPVPYITVEQRVDFSDYVAEGFGTADCIIIAEPTLRIIDFKYGVGTPVSAEGEDGLGNSQLMLYALGALSAYGTLFDIETVSMSIVQPRRDNISTFEMPVSDLNRWAEEVLKPTAELAYNGEGDYAAGAWCKFCRVKAECRARAEANMELAKYDFIKPPLLENDEVAFILGKIDELVSWATDIKNFALTEALNGTRFDGWKVVEGRSNRKYTDETAVAEAVKGIGLDPYEHKVLGVTAMTTLLGKKRFDETIGIFITKPQGKPVLVPGTDKRQEININTAADDFADPIEN